VRHIYAKRSNGRLRRDGGPGARDEEAGVVQHISTIVVVRVAHLDHALAKEVFI